jgi:lipoprotein NlpD
MMTTFSSMPAVSSRLVSRTASGLRTPLALVLALGLAACAAPHRPAPVEDRTVRTSPGVAASAAGLPAPPAAAASGPVDPRTLPGYENMGKPGYYTVKPADTIIRIGLETGQNWRDIARWNGMENPNLIEVGQVLRVQPPDAGLAATKPIVTTARVESKPLEGPRGASAPAAAPSAPVAAASAATPAPPPVVVAAVPPVPPAASAPPAPSNVPQAPRDDDDPGWAWPAGGPVLANYDEARNKGLSIGGKSGDPVFAAADGRVVYAGSGLRGYGNLVIVKHNATYLTAYAHNQALLVKEDQPVRRGQKIAEMGATDAERVQLHFEIRRQGKPVDPARLLPPR